MSGSDIDPTVVTLGVPIRKSLLREQIEIIKQAIQDLEAGGTGGGGVTDHGLLAGLGDDDHTQYFTSPRADDWFLTKTVPLSQISPATTERKLIGRSVGVGAGIWTEINEVELRTIIGLASASARGLVPETGGSTGRFLRDDLTWTTGAGGGGSGDMLKSVYDPGNINGSAFALSLHTGDAGDLVAVPGSGLAGTTIEAQLFELSINQSGDGRTIREGTDFGMGSSSSPTDLVWGTPSGNDVTVTSAGNQLPVLIAGQHVEVDHPTAANDGVYLVVTSTVGTLSLTKITGSAPVSAVAATVALTWYYPIDPADARDRWLEVLGSVANSDQLTASMIIRPDPRVSLWGTRLGDAARGYVEKGDDSAFSVTLGGLGTAGTVTRTLSSPGDNLHWARITSDATYKFVVETHIPPADLRTKFFSGAGATTPAATNKGVVLSTTGAFLGIAPLEDLILALSVSTGKIADLAVTAAKIATGVIAETHLAAGVSRRFYEPVDGRAANGNITNLTNAHSGKSIRIDQDTTLDAAFGAGLTSPDQAFVEVWNDSAASKTLTRGGTGTINGATSVTIAAGGTIIVNCLSNAGTSAVCIARGDFTSVDMTNRNLLNIGAGSTFQTPSATLAALGGVPLAGGTMTGALLGGGFAMSGFTYGSESVSGTLNQSHVGKRLTTTGTVTIPTNVTGWWAKFILGAVTHDFTFNSITKDSSTLGWGVGDHFLFEVTSATTAQMTRTPAANVVSF